jgi:phosphoribosylanthranilate isomerase
MFSSMTMASSTTKPTERVSAISERLFRLYPSRYMAAKVPMIESGTAAPGISVAERLRRNRKMTMITRHTVSTRVNSTSWIDPRIDSEASKAMSIFTAGGISPRNVGSSLLMLSTTSTVLVPGWR